MFASQPDSDTWLPLVVKIDGRAVGHAIFLAGVFAVGSKSDCFKMLACAELIGVKIGTGTIIPWAGLPTVDYGILSSGLWIGHIKISFPCEIYRLDYKVFL